MEPTGFCRLYHFFLSALLIFKYNSVENLDEIEARSGPSAKRRLSMHSDEGADSEGGDSLDSLSLYSRFPGQCQREEEGGGLSC